MLIHGSNTIELLTEKISDACPKCGSSQTMKMSVFQKYGHLFWIPCFPIGRIGATQCTNCKQVLRNKEFNESLNYHFETLLKRTKTPVWTYSGVFIAVTMTILFTIQSKETAKHNAELLANPQRNDIYEVRIAPEEYTLYKVDYVIGDSVFVLVNRYETNSYGGLTKIKEKPQDSYYPEPKIILKSELKTMLEKYDISEINRK
jgi:hypothetical protein